MQTCLIACALSALVTKLDRIQHFQSIIRYRNHAQSAAFTLKAAKIFTVHCLEYAITAILG